MSAYYVKADGQKRIVYFANLDGIAHYHFAQKLNDRCSWRPLIPDGYAYDNGGSLYKAAVDMAVKKGII